MHGVIKINPCNDKLQVGTHLPAFLPTDVTCSSTINPTLCFESHVLLCHQAKFNVSILYYITLYGFYTF